MDDQMLLLGVDGGGTKTTVVACNYSGEYLGSISCGNINYNAVGMKTARENIAEGINRILQKTGRKDYCFITIGHSALDDVATNLRISAYSHPLLLK